MSLTHMFAESLSCEGYIVLSAVPILLFSMVLGVSIGVLSVLGYQRCRRSVRSSQSELKCRRQSLLCMMSQRTLNQTLTLKVTLLMDMFNTQGDNSPHSLQLN